MIHGPPLLLLFLARLELLLGRCHNDLLPFKRGTAPPSFVRNAVGKHDTTYTQIDKRRKEKNRRALCGLIVAEIALESRRVGKDELSAAVALAAHPFALVLLQHRARAVGEKPVSMGLLYDETGV